MMTREMVIEQVEALGEDASYQTDADGDLHITINDFDGFDEHWAEIEREYDNPDAVEAFLERLETEAHEAYEDCYDYYVMDGFTVKVGYTSFEI